MFKTDIKVRFSHVDFAGIVFYPRYFEMFNQVIEEWFEGPLECDFRRLDDEFNAGVPAAHIDVDFTHPSRLGDVLTFSLSVSDVGKSSITIGLECTCNSETRLKANLTLVYIVKMPSGEFSVNAIPPDLKKLILAT